MVLAVRPSARRSVPERNDSLGEIAVSGAFDRPPKWARKSSSTLRYRAVTRSPALAFLFDSHSSNHPRTVCAGICSPDEIATISAISLRPCAAVSSLRRAFMAAFSRSRQNSRALRRSSFWWIFSAVVRRQQGSCTRKTASRDA